MSKKHSTQKFETCKPYFQLFSSLQKSEVQSILKSLKRKTELVDCIGELAYNICGVGIIELSESEKKYLRRFQSLLHIISDKKRTPLARSRAIEKSPQLVKALSIIALERLWPSPCS